MLGYTNELWDAGNELAPMGWNDLSQEQMLAALCIGYTSDDFPASRYVCGGILFSVSLWG